MDPAVAPDQLKSPFTIKVFFGDLVPRESLIAQLKEVRRRAQETLDELRRTERAIEDEPRLFYPRLTLRGGLAHAEADLRWAVEAIDELERRDVQ